MRIVRSFFLLLVILTIYKCNAQYQTQKHYGDTLRYAYIVLFENENQLTSDKKLKIEQRLNQLSYLINTFNKEKRKLMVIIAERLDEVNRPQNIFSAVNKRFSVNRIDH